MEGVFLAKIKKIKIHVFMGRWYTMHTQEIKYWILSLTPLFLSKDSHLHWSLWFMHWLIGTNGQRVCKSRMHGRRYHWGCDHCALITYRWCDAF